MHAILSIPSLLRRAVAPFLALFFLASPALADRLLLDFAAEKPASWTPFLGAPRPSRDPSGQGLSFSLPFAGKADRAACDRAFPAPLDLSASSQFALDLSCPRPDAMRHLGLYFKSGNGWYVCNKPLASSGPQRLLFYKGDFSTEGTPAGWNRVSAVRISPWKGPAAVDSALLLRRLSALEGPLLLVQPTSSCPDAATRAVAARTAALLSRLLAESGVPHSLATDDNLPAALPRATAALLPYNPHPAPAARDALLAFLKRDGRLGVFYSADPALARAMGFKLGPWMREERPDRWRSIVPASADALPGCPPRVHQHSSSLMPATPDSPTARVVARWCDASSAPAPEPAVVASPRGFWMSHILLADDLPEKRDFALALAASLDPALWEPAARLAAATAAAFPPYATLDQALAALTAALPSTADPAQNRALLSRASSSTPAITAALARRDWFSAWRLARAQHNILQRVHAATLPPRPGEFVGVWDHSGTGGDLPGGWAAVAPRLRALGVTAVFANLAWGGTAHYPSTVVPPSRTCALRGDQLAAARAATAAAGLQLHAWIVLWKLDGAPPEFVEKMKKEGRLQVSADGKTTLPWLSPHHPANRQLMKDLIAEIVRRCPTIDGIHLDYIRLPDARSCYSPTTRSRFEAAVKKPVARWPADVAPGGPRHAQFREWRARDITSFVEDVRVRLRRIAPSVKLSAAVYAASADSPDGGNIAQPWPSWLSRGLVDFVTPMDYTESEIDFERLVRKQTALPSSSGRIYPGIGVTATESRLDPVQTARQLMLARKYACPGVVLFSLTPTLLDTILPPLRSGPLRPAP
jgi:uncharacterized lipoprotein YddW (UPF0748 family)